MAGGVARTFGVLFLILGVLALVAGGAAAVYGYVDQQDHKDSRGPAGIGEDPDRTERNEALLAGGGVAAAGGLVLVVAGIVLLVVAGARSRSELLLALSGSGGGGREDRARGKFLVSGLVVLGALVVVLAAVLAEGGSLGMDNGSGQASSEVFDGTVQPSVSLPTVGTVSPTAPRHVLSAPLAATRLVAVLDWTAGPGVETLSLDLEQNVGGQWRTAATADGGPGFVLESSIDQASQWRIVAWANDTGPSPGTDYTLEVTYA